MKSKKTAASQPKGKGKIKNLKLHKETIEDLNMSDEQAAKVKGGITQVCATDGCATKGGGASIYTGGVQCWVARAVYGEENPRWKMFREWLLADAPAWFRDLYASYGERFARWIAPHPMIKAAIRRWMDSRIERRSLALAQGQF